MPQHILQPYLDAAVHATAAAADATHVAADAHAAAAAHVAAVANCCDSRKRRKL